MTYEPMNGGIAYSDMTPQQRQEYHARIAAARRPSSGGLVHIDEPIGTVFNEIADAALNTQGRVA